MSKKHHGHDAKHPTESAAASPSETTAHPTPETSHEQTPGDPRDVEIAALKDRLMRLQADFDNFRKRTIRDREDTSRRAAESLLKELLPVSDHLDLGIRAAHTAHLKHTVVEGLEGVLKQLQSVLEKAGVTPIETHQQPFDPHCHECVANIPSEAHLEGIIIEETRKGYKLGNYVLRASQVIVSTGPASPALSAEAQPDAEIDG